MKINHNTQQQESPFVFKVDGPSDELRSFDVRELLKVISGNHATGVAASIDMLIFDFLLLGEEEELLRHQREALTILKALRDAFMKGAGMVDLSSLSSRKADTLKQDIEMFAPHLVASTEAQR